MARKQTYTHFGVLRGCDARTSLDAKHGTLLRRGKVHWITEHGNRYALRDGRGVGDWPMWHLELDTIRELAEPVKR